jgi:cell division protein FtsB
MVDGLRAENFSLKEEVKSLKQELKKISDEAAAKEHAALVAAGKSF